MAPLGGRPCMVPGEYNPPSLTPSLLQVIPCILAALFAHPKTNHWFMFRVRGIIGAGGIALGCTIMLKRVLCLWMPLGIRTLDNNSDIQYNPDSHHSIKSSSEAFSLHERHSVASPPRAQVMWAFCVYLESVSVLPQLRMMQKAKVRSHPNGNSRGEF